MIESEDKRAPFWLPPKSLFTIGLIIALLSFPPAPYALVPFRVTGQALLLIILIRLFCYWSPMVRWFTSMPIPHRAVFGLVLASMILGHYTINSRTNFPFITWFIFPSVIDKNPVTCREFIATTASGKKVRLLVEQLFPSIIQIDPLDDPKYYPPETIDHLATTLAKAYNTHYADDPVHRVDFVNMAVALHPPANESRAEPSCQLLKTYDVSSGL